MDSEPQRYPPQSFILRLWQEDLGEAGSEWRGQLRHVTSGRVFYFREWQALIGLLLETLAEPSAPQEPN